MSNAHRRRPWSTNSKIAAGAVALALIASLLAIAGCTTTTTIDPATGAVTTDQKVDMPRVRAASDVLVTTLRDFADMVRARPGFDAAKQADLDKAMAALDAAHGMVKALPDGDITAADVLSALATAAVPVISILPLSAEQRSRAQIGLAGVRLLIPLIGVR